MGRMFNNMIKTLVWLVIILILAAAGIGAVLA